PRLRPPRGRRGVRRRRPRLTRRAVRVTDPRVRRLAEVIVNFSVELREGDLVLIHGAAVAEPLLVELVRAATEAGAIARVRPTVSGTDEAYLARASDAQLDHLPPWAVEEMEAIDARISVHASLNTRELTAIDPAKIAR